MSHPKSYRIISKYNGKITQIDKAIDENSARYLVNEYQMCHASYGENWKVWAEDTKGKKLE